MKVLEIACSNFQSCINAERGEADRIELIENIADGGCTPSFGMIKLVKEKIKLPIYVMIRPRGGDFYYSVEEFEIMKRDIQICKTLEVDGIVFGILNQDNKVDIDRCKRLMDEWGSSKATFHRAIDITIDMNMAVNEIIKLGFERILTSGREITAEQGIEKIEALNRKFGKRISIMAGSGISHLNAHLFSSLTEIHSTCKSIVNSSELFGNYTESDVERIKLLRKKIDLC